MKRRYIWPIIILFLVLATCALLYWHHGSWRQVAGQEVSVLDTDGDEAKIKEILRQRTREQQQENQRLMTSFKASLEEKGKGSFLLAEKNIRPFVEEVTSFDFSGRLFVCMAEDYLRDTNTAMELLSPVLMKHIILPCEQGAGEIEASVNDFLLKLQESDTQFKAGLTDYMKLNNIQGMEHRPHLEKFLGANTKLAEKVEKYAQEKIMAAIGTAMEVVFLKSTYECIRKVTMPVVLRLATSWAIGGASSAADGPLLVGDIIGAVIAVGGTAWTAYDVYQVSSVLPAELGHEVSKLEETYRKEIKKVAIACAEEALEQCERDCEDFLLSLK